jgi:hypothetical protein
MELRERQQRQHYNLHIYRGQGHTHDYLYTDEHFHHAFYYPHAYLLKDFQQFQQF